MESCECCKVLSNTLGYYVSYFERETSHYRGNNKGKENKEHHEFISSGNSTAIVHCLSAVKKHIQKNLPKDVCGCPPALKFLDAGCGVGNVMLLAESLGFRVKGIEYDTKTRRLGNELFDPGSFYKGKGNKVKKGDITTFRGYKNYDVIYFYVPIKNGEKMRKFLAHLKKGMKVGAVVIPYSHSLSTESFEVDERFEQIYKEDWNLPAFQKVREGK